MTKLRTWMALLLVWMCLLLNIERLHKPINIASFVYVLAGLLAIAVIALPPLRSAALSWVVGGAIALLLALKPLLGYELLGSHLPLTVTEVAVVALTVLLAHQVALSIRHFEQGAAEFLTLARHSLPPSFDEGRDALYREVRRARKYQRPLCLVALEPSTQSVHLSTHRMLEEVQRNTARNYVLARLGELLLQEVNDCDIVTQSGDRFVVALAETTPEQAQEVVSRLAALAEERLGLRLQAGTAVFPEEEVTLGGLLDRAETDLQPVAAQSGRAAERPVAEKSEREQFVPLVGRASAAGGSPAASAVRIPS